MKFENIYLTVLAIILVIAIIGMCLYPPQSMTDAMQLLQ
jgi:hypothetical protein